MPRPDRACDMPQPDPNPTPPQAGESSADEVAARQRRGKRWTAAAAVGFAAMLGVTTWQAFERDTQTIPLAAVEPTDEANSGAGVSPAAHAERPDVAWPSMAPERSNALPVEGAAAVYSVENVEADAPPSEPPIQAEPTSLDRAAAIHPSQTRDAGLLVDGQPWTGPTFDGRPIRPVRTVTMRTTAYSPDERSCGKWADGITASGMSVWTNGMKLAAADPSIPFGTILTVPGYNDNQPIPVLDRGGAIKGHRLDLLYPTHDIAMQWGVQDLEVVVWEYADE